MIARGERFGHDQQSIVGLLAIGKHPRRFLARCTLGKLEHSDQANPIVGLRLAHRGAVTDRVGFPDLDETGLLLHRGAVETQHRGRVVVERHGLDDDRDIIGH